MSSASAPPESVQGEVQVEVAPPGDTPRPVTEVAAVVVKLGQGQQAAKESEETPTTSTSTTTTTTTTNNATTEVAGSDSGTVVVVNQLKCSLTLDKLPKRVRLALTRNNKKKSVAHLATLLNGQQSTTATTEVAERDDPSILCQFCDRSCPDRQQYALHKDQEHRTANLGRRASGRASSINSFPGCSMCNVADNKQFASHSNDLDALFAHLLEKHADRYFGCRLCNVRYPDADTLTVHNETVHQATRGRDRRKSTSGSRELLDKNGADVAAVVVVAVDNEKIERKVTRQSNSSSNSNNHHRSNEEQFESSSSSLSRMAQAQNKFPLRGPARAIKGRLAANNQKANETRNGARAAKLTRSTSVSSTGSNTVSSQITNSSSSSTTPPPTLAGSFGSFADKSGTSGASSGKLSSVLTNNVFDENFYETITLTVRRNLSKWVDGKIENDKEKRDRVAESLTDEAERLSPELLLDHPPPAVRSTLFRTPPVDTALCDNEIHEATALAAVTAFPTLLTAEQYGLEGQAGGKIKRMFTKNSWKWKWDFVKKYKYVNEGGKLVKKAKEQNLGQRDLSKLDMWTQLTMRTKHEVTKLPQRSEESESELDSSAGSSSAAIGESVRAEKRRQVNQLDTILDSRLLPQIVTEQNEQRLIKLEAEEEDIVDVAVVQLPSSSSSSSAKAEDVENDDFPLGLRLRRNPNPVHHATNLTLSGEWARPRCYVCFGCGAKFETVKLLQDHKLTEHPNTQTTHYEMVGRELIEGNLHQHLYIPKKAISTGNEHQRSSVGEETEKPQRGRRANPVITKLADDAMVPCSKCKKDCAGRFELYRHMLDCVGDYAWLMAKKRFKYRYYGNRSRRRKSNARSIFGCIRAPKKTVKKESLERIKRRKMRSRARKPQKPSDAETIEKMLANLPEKRISRTIATPPTSASKSTGTPAATNLVTPTKPNPPATPASLSSTGKKVQSSSRSSSSTATMNPAGSASSTKRNLRSTLEAETKAGGATGSGKGIASKKGKVATATATDKREVKVPAKVAAAEKSESEKIKDTEIVPEPPSNSLEKSDTKSTATAAKQQQQQQSTKRKEDGDEAVVDSGKKKTLMTRLASNTKGIIKKIGRKMKGNKKKKDDSEAKNSSPVPFLDEAAQDPRPVEEEKSVTIVEVGRPEAVVQEAAEREPVGDLTKPEAVENASVAVDNEELRQEEVNVNAAKEVTAPVAICTETIAQNTLSIERSPPAAVQEKQPDELNKSTLSLPDLFSPQISPSMSVPSNPSNLSSPMTSPTMQKRRVRKLNDCIARLTDKLQEKLAKPLIAAPEQPVDDSPVVIIDVPKPSFAPRHRPETKVEYKELSLPLDVPLNLSLKKDFPATTSSNLLQLAPEPEIPVPTVDDCGVVDLSFKDKSKNVKLPPIIPAHVVEMTIPRIVTKQSTPIPEVVVNSICPEPTTMLRRPEELMKMPQNPPIADQPLVNAQGELIVPHVPKMGNYEVIKIPTYLPQKPTKASRRQSSKAAVASAAMKKSSTTSAIEKITEMVADIVRNKKREAARKAGLAAIPLVLPVATIPEPVEVIRAVEPLPELPPIELQRTETAPSTSGRKRATKSKVQQIVPEVSKPQVESVELPVVSAKDDLAKTILPPVVNLTVPEVVAQVVVIPDPEPESAPLIDDESLPVSTLKENQQQITTLEKPPPKSKVQPKAKKKVVIVEPAEIIEPVQQLKEIVTSKPSTPSRSRRQVSEKKATASTPAIEDKLKVNKEMPVEEKVKEGPNGMIKRLVGDRTGKGNKKVTIVEPHTKESVIEDDRMFLEKAVPQEDPIAEKPVEEPSISPVGVTKIRKKRQSELAQILAAQPVINNTERDISLTRRKSISIPDPPTKRIESPKPKPSPPKKKRDNSDIPAEDVSPTTVVTEMKEAAGDVMDLPIEQPIEKIQESAMEKEETEAPNKIIAKGKVRANKKSKQREKSNLEEEKPSPELDDKSTPIVTDPLPEIAKEPEVLEEPKNPTPKPKKKRRSELTQIIADQLLESFKEVDESQKDNLKILHDLSWADETMEIASRLKQSPIPRRQVTKKKPQLVENPRKSPAVLVKSALASPNNNTSQQRRTTTTSDGGGEGREEVTQEQKPQEEEQHIKVTSISETIPDTKAISHDIRSRELNVSLALTSTLEPEKPSTLPISEKDVLISPNQTSSLFNTPVTGVLKLTPKPQPVATGKPISSTSSSHEDVSLFWPKQSQDKEANTEKHLNWITKASELVSTGVKSGNVSDESSTNKAAKSAAVPLTTFVLKPSRLQAIASPPLVDSFDQLRNCDRSSNSSTFCSPVVSPIGEPKMSLLNALTFPTPIRPANGGPPLKSPPPINLLQFRDGPREVDESDGDLEDNVSVHSSDSMESSMTSMTKSKAPRKRRKRSLLTKKKVRGQGAVKANKENGPTVEKFHCEICNKTFEKADRLAKHKITLTHISRLSELEFLNSQNAKTETVPEVKVSLPDSIPTAAPQSPEPQLVAAVGTGAAVAPTPLLVPNHHRSPLTPGLHNNQSTLHNVHLEPISSPEQPQQSYLMSSGLPSGGARTENSFGAALAHQPKRPTMSVSGLSQEEKLFYECCNMLKGSDRVGTQSENNSLTPRSNEAVSTWYSKTSTAFAIRSPTGNNYRQRSPKYAFSKLDLNQFSDISSDSDNTYPSRARPLVNGSSGAQAVAASFQNVIVGGREPVAVAPGPQIMAASNCNPVGNMAAGGGIVSPLRQNDAAAAAGYSDSDMGDSFPSAPGASDNESYVRTILDRSINNNGTTTTTYAGRGGEWTANVLEGAGYRRGEDVAFVDNSAGGKVKTKAAMKGFDNFRVSIPTDGLDMNQALLSGGIVHHNPHLDSKLASLADIALRSSTLPLIETAISALHQDQVVVEDEQEEEASKETEELESDDDEEEKGVRKSPSKRPVKNGRRVQQTRTDKNSVGNRLGFKAKKRKGADVNAAELGKASAEGCSKNGLDVYDFEDSQGSVEAPILPMKKCGKVVAVASEGTVSSVPLKPPAETVSIEKPKPARGRPAIKKATKSPVAVSHAKPSLPIDPEVLEPSSQNSSDSFSDRDDFNYNSPVVEEDSDISSQESPVKIPSTPPLKSVQAAGKKVPKKPLDNVQKKCLIMGRIFKNAQKNHKPEPTKASVQSSSSSVSVPEEGVKKEVPKVELDQLFDSLKGAASKSSSKRGIEFDRKNASQDVSVKSKESNSAVVKTGGPKRGELKVASILKRVEKKSRATNEDSDEDKETKKLIEDLVNDDLAVGQRKSKRKCIQQVNFVETWSSDEYEEFHSTKDIIAMIEANEKKAGPGRKKKLPSATVEEPIKMPVEKKAGKIQNRRKTIGFKETDEDLGRGKKDMSGRYSPIRSFGGSKSSAMQKEATAVVVTGGVAKGESAKQVGRQKRVSSEKLYYWSSSSSAEEGDGAAMSAKGLNGKVKGAGGKGAMATGDEDEDNDSAMEQHGWIVGGSHKKLVTLLAHAKGKKSDVLPKK